jgi:hypothetical protein
VAGVNLTAVARVPSESSCLQEAVEYWSVRSFFSDAICLASPDASGGNHVLVHYSAVWMPEGLVIRQARRRGII